MQIQEDYRVSLDSFDGPLDLLLYLIRRAEVDIHDIPIALITEQYLAFLARVEDIDVELAGEFLVMAATLIELKSRTLMPAAPDDPAENTSDSSAGREEVDPRLELVQQLLDYQRFRIASEELENRRLEFAQRFPLRPGRRDRAHEAEAAEPIEIELEDVHVYDLADAYERIMASIDFNRLGDHIVEMDDTPIALYEADLLDRLRRRTDHRLTLQDAFEGASRPQRIGLFIATLELTRLRRITVQQDEIESPIELILSDDDDDALIIESDEIQTMLTTDESSATVG